MKRILIFSVAYHPFIGGAEIATKEIIDRLTGQITFDMITLNLDGVQKSVEQMGNVRVYRIGKKGKIYKLLFPFAACLLALRLYKKEKYDAIWSIMASFSGFAALFFKLKHSTIPFILTLQEGDPISYIKRQVWFVYPLFILIFKKADHIQTISNYLADFARSMGARVPVKVIPNGVPLEVFSRIFSEDDIKKTREHIGIRDHERIVITVSRLVEKNAVDSLIQSLLYLPEHIKLLIVGVGDLQKKLEKVVSQNNLDTRVLFLGAIPHNKIPEYLAIADVFVRPSRSEGMGNVFIEAMAAGVPIVATPVGGIVDFLKDEETGLVCIQDNPRDIADKVSRLLSDQALRKRIISNSRALAKNYNWDHIADEMMRHIFSRI